jgi:DDE_Tnp_1-associated
LPCQDATSSLPAVGRSACDDDGDLQGYASLLECLDGVPDLRRRQGMRHRAAVVLAFAVAAVMAGADSVAAIAEWALDLPPEVLAALGARRDREGRLVPPSLSTSRRVLRATAARVSGESNARTADSPETAFTAGV